MHWCLTDWKKRSNIPGSNLYANLSEYVIALGEFLFRWQLYQKRAELLQCLPEIFSSRARTHDAEQRLGTLILKSLTILGSKYVFISVVLPLCQQCGVEMLRSSDLPCQICRVQSQKPCCSVCRLPVIGMIEYLSSEYLNLTFNRPCTHMFDLLPYNSCSMLARS